MIFESDAESPAHHVDRGPWWAVTDVVDRPSAESVRPVRYRADRVCRSGPSAAGLRSLGVRAREIGVGQLGARVLASPPAERNADGYGLSRPLSIAPNRPSVGR